MDFYLNGTYALYQIEGNKIRDMELFESSSIKTEQTTFVRKGQNVILTSHNGIFIDWGKNNRYLTWLLDDIANKEIQTLLFNSIIKNDIYHLQLEKGSLWLLSNLNNAVLDQMIRELKSFFQKSYNYEKVIDSILLQPIIYWIRKAGLHGDFLELLREFYRIKEQCRINIECIEIEAIAKI